MMQMEARIEELNNLMKGVKILKDFQVACKKRTGRALSQKKDARVQLISAPKLRAKMKSNERKIPALYKGPPENLQVANYREALATFSVSISREKWSNEERENLVKGVKQQFQERLLQRSVDIISDADGFYDSNNVDSIIVSIKDLEITPEKLRLFLPKVNWEQVAAMYVPGRSGEECQARFLNSEDPLINHNPWTTVEDKNLLHIVQQKGVSNWIDIAASLGTNRTPFQCLARYQRSLNASILKREWTKEEDNQLCAAVETCGESNWQVVASVMEGRTGTQCSNRWLKTLHPTRKRVGKWTAEEDKRLKVAVKLFGPKTWKKVASCVPGRTQVQCRERWVNNLDPSLNMAEWTEEEDSKLEAAIAEHGYCWSKVAACIPRRTDNQCLRRWKVLFKTEVPLLQAARKIQKAALISNFVDREGERPALGPNDFRVPEAYRIAGSENVDLSKRKNTRSRQREGQGHEHGEKDAFSSPSGISSENVPRLTDGSELENLQDRPEHRKGRGRNSRSMNSSAGPSSNGHLPPHSDTVSLDMCNREEIRKSHVSDGNGKRKPRSQKKRSEHLDAAPTSSAVIVFEPHNNEDGDSDPTKEFLPTTACLDLQGVPVGGELGGDDTTQCRNSTKPHARKRHGKMLEEVPGTSSQVGEQAVTKRKMAKEEKGRADSTNDHPSSTLDSMLLMDMREATEAAPGIKSRKRKRKTQETCSSSDFVSLAVDDRPVNLTPASMQNTALLGDGSGEPQGEIFSPCLAEVAAPNQHHRSETDDAVPDMLESSALSARDSNMQDKENAMNEENTTLASFLRQSGRKIFSNKMARVKVRLEDDNKALEEAGDDTTLAHFYKKLKQRRTRVPVMQHQNH